MTVNVTLGKRKVIDIVVKVPGTGQITGDNPVTVQNLPAPPTRRLDALADVDATAEVEGGVPVYYAANDTYVVEQLNLSADIEEIDGGSF